MGQANGKLSDWKIITSSGGSGGATAFIVTVQGITGDLYFSKNANTGLFSPEVGVLSYYGIGAGPSVPTPIPFDLSTSRADMPSGGVLRHGPLSNGKEFALTDLAGPCVVQVVSGGVGLCYSKTVVYFGPTSVAHPLHCKAIGILSGWGETIPGLSDVTFACRMKVSRMNAEIYRPRELRQTNLRMPHFQNIPRATSCHR